MIDFAERLIGWYTHNKRDLPWRNERDPYKIWLSEVILQQTRVQQGLPYYLRFVEHYPTVIHLAAAQEADVLRLWQGLGYYSRARNMHQTARYVSEHLQGIFPTAYTELLKLKGVGTYTAAAIASFSADEAVAVVDGNVYRVLARVFGVEQDIASPKGQKVFAQLAQSLFPAHQGSIYNQAIMEFGAMHCKPINPDCMFCIFNVECFARRQHRVADLPYKSKKIKVKERYFHYLLLEYQGRLLMKRRGSGDIWEGLYDFALVEQGKDFSFDKIQLFEGFDENSFSLQDESDFQKHILTHQRLFAKFYHIKITNEALFEALKTNFALLPYSQEEINNLAKPILIHHYLKNCGYFLH